MTKIHKIFGMKHRFRGFLPVVVDVETSGVQPEKNALLEICVVLLSRDDRGQFSPGERFFEHVLPFDGAVLDPDSLAFNGIDPFQPLRFALDEATALERLFTVINQAVKQHHCQRAVLVGHNAWFDLLFIKAAAKRCGLTSPFHAFTCFDTATLSGLFYGQTVLSKAMQHAKVEFNSQEAHSAIYDAEKTAVLFCKMLNTWSDINNSSDLL